MIVDEDNNFDDFEHNEPRAVQQTNYKMSEYITIENELMKMNDLLERHIQDCKYIWETCIKRFAISDDCGILKNIDLKDFNDFMEFMKTQRCYRKITKTINLLERRKLFILTGY